MRLAEQQAEHLARTAENNASAWDIADQEAKRAQIHSVRQAHHLAGLVQREQEVAQMQATRVRETEAQASDAVHKLRSELQQANEVLAI